MPRLLTRPTPSRAVDLAAVVRTVAADVARWQPLVHFAEEGRWWTKLSGNGEVDVWLLTWLREQRTDWHDHGRSWAAFSVVRGALQEARVDELLQPESSTLYTGDTGWVAPGAVHDVYNDRDEPAVSIHAYSPPLSHMTYFALGAGRLEALRTVRTDQPEGVGPR